jgi:hypothetical protein
VHTAWQASCAGNFTGESKINTVVSSTVPFTLAPVWCNDDYGDDDDDDADNNNNNNNTKFVHIYITQYAKQ